MSTFRMVGQAPIQPHLLPDEESRKALGEFTINQGHQCLTSIAEGLRKNALKKEAEARALLTTVKSLYGSNNTGFNQSWIKIKDFCKKERAICQCNLDRQEAALRANIPTAANVIKQRLPENNNQSQERACQVTSGQPKPKRGRRGSRVRSSGSRDRRGGQQPAGPRQCAREQIPRGPKENDLLKLLRRALQSNNPSRKRRNSRF